MIQVYTGDGKGKTTAALGLALRASGHGRKVVVIQFMKGDIDYGEVKAARRFKCFELYQFGLPTFVKKGAPSDEDIRLAREGIDFARKTISEGAHDIVILDEINVAVDFCLLEMRAVLALIDLAPPDMELVLTGRNAPPEFIERADLVTEMREIKHPFAKGTPAREGIEH
ncbi:MAG TPA: cob(I)yrinic acid a,c-diamide adenosyltransferase [candidate division Zixibacteria bacterium]|mgnify:CR=1 FL=1|nr:cob(I)yrinic acid a,c-diamide adenosyltransferase [candidate division Zixibacteria bacterium]